MRTLPDRAQLLQLAHQVLRDELLPALPAGQRHAGLMLVNALAIAARQAGPDEAQARAELAVLGRLLAPPAGNPPADAAALQTQLHTAYGVLVSRLRSGTLAHRAAVHRHLMALTRRQVEQSNPKYLATPAQAGADLPRTTPCNP